MEETKRCPYCGEEILAIAKKCKHCGEWLESEEEAIHQKQIVCPVCGEQIDDGLDVCPICNESIHAKENITVNSNSIESRSVSFSSKKVVNWKKITLSALGALAVILIIVFVSSKTSDNDSDISFNYDQETKDDIASVTKWLTNTYNDVLTGNDYDGLKIRKYVSSSFYEIFSEIVNYDNAINSDGYFDFDFWTHSKGGSGWKMQIEEVLPVEGGLSGGKEYAARFLLTDNTGIEKHLAVSLVKEEGDWRISDFIENGNSQIGEMRSYLTSAKENVQKAINAAQEAMDIWEGLYRTNEFGEAISSCPYIRAREIAPGTDLCVEIGKCDGMRFELTLVADDFGGANRFAIKTLNNNEVFTFPFKEDHGLLYITDKDAINHIITIMANGNYIISVTREQFGKTENITAQVGIETKGIIDALEFLN